MMGSGKTTVARVFARLGAAVIDADRLGRELLDDPDIRRRLEKAFGPAVIGPDGSVDRARLAEIAFAAREGARQLDRITREPLLDRIRAEIERLRGKAEAVVVDAALLPEWKARDWLDVLVVVDSDEKICLERAATGRGFDFEDVERRMACQFSRRQKNAQADIIIPNVGTAEDLRERARKVFNTLMATTGKG
jgi:dephospho-CoA kinase